MNRKRNIDTELLLVAFILILQRNEYSSTCTCVHVTHENQGCRFTKPSYEIQMCSFIVVKHLWRALCLHPVDSTVFLSSMSEIQHTLVLSFMICYTKDLTILYPLFSTHFLSIRCKTFVFINLCSGALG